MDRKTPKVEPRAYTINSLVSMGFGCKTFLYEQIKNGRLVARKLNKRTLVLARDLDAFCESLPSAQEEFKKRDSLKYRKLARGKSMGEPGDEER